MNAEQERIEALRVKASMEQAEGQRKAHRERIHAEIIRDINEALRDSDESSWRKGNGCQGDDLTAAIAAGRIRHLRIIY